jgi:hypothetical protein
VLSLCKAAGLVKVGVIAIDGTKLHANASHHASLDDEQLAREILKEAARIDAAEGELYGEQRGDELPEQLRTSEGVGPRWQTPGQARARSGEGIHRCGDG